MNTKKCNVALAALILVACTATASAATFTDEIAITQNSIPVTPATLTLTDAHPAITVAFRFGISFTEDEKKAGFICGARMELSGSDNAPVDYPLKGGFNDYAGSVGIYSKGGKYTVTLHGVAQNGHPACSGGPKVAHVTIVDDRKPPAPTAVLVNGANVPGVKPAGLAVPVRSNVLAKPKP